MHDAIIVEGLTKVFETKEKKGLFRGKKKRIVAVNNIHFKVVEGEIFGLLGPNGAGKTTTIKMLSTLLLPDKGEAWVNGYHIVKEASKVRESVGVSLYSDRGFYWKLTGRENLKYFAYLYHLDSKTVNRRVEYLLELVDLKEDADRLVEEYSTGMKSKLNFARALLHDPPILFLDEPTIGLDPNSARSIREIILNFKKEGKTILLTTHNMFEAEQLCDRIAIINKGRIVAIGTPSELKEFVNKRNIVVIEAANISEKTVSIIKKVDGVSRVTYRVRDPQSMLGEIRVAVNGNLDSILPDILKLVMDSSMRVISISPSEPTLEDVFVELTGEKFEES